MKDVLWQESHLSDTVIEFKAIRQRKDSTETILALLIIALLVTSVILTVPIYVHILSSVTIFCIMISHRNHIVEESVLVVRDFGVQLKQKDASGSEHTKFLDRNKVDSVFIHECIRGSAVNYQLAFLLRGERNSMSVSFKHVYPGLKPLERVLMSVSQNWRGSGGSQPF